MERELEIAWAAGFLDGEGYIAVVRDKPVIEATQIVRAPLERLHRLFGGSLCTMGKPTKGGNVIFRWRMTHTPVVFALAEMYPLLVVKKEAADTILKRWDRDGFGLSDKALRGWQTRRANQAILM